ncbi:hypothetical protein F4859DRAFT_526757 [Xylaria cf. heliscus]|nr:hypothetical protein F4859DRAFT_526757 [Xylaria cf. heliscus]
MSQTKRRSPRHDDPTPRVKRSKHRRVCDCHECGHGPFNAVLDAGCAICRNRRCGFCAVEWVPVEEEPVDDISPPPQTQQPSRRAALPIAASHVPHSSNSNCRASTPFNNTVSELSNFGLTSFSPITDLLQHDHVIGTGTSAQSESSSQQANTSASEQWRVASYENNLVQVHVHGDIHDPLSSAGATSSEDTRSRLPNGFSHPISNPAVNYALHPASETAGSSLGALQSSQSDQVEHTIPISASATDAEGQFIQGRTIPIYTCGITSDALLPGCSTFLTDASFQFSTDSDGPGHAIRSVIPWGFEEDFTISIPVQPPPIDNEPPELSPSSVSSLDIPKPSQSGRTINGDSIQCDSCKPGESRLLACPFYKYDRRLHMKCMLKGFDTIGHLNQHLKKKHKLGTIHCTSCWRTFDTAESLTNHNINTCVPTGGVPVDDLPGFTKIRLPADKKWLWAWKKLFGDAPPQCPFSHPSEDLKPLPKDNSNAPKSQCLEADWIGVDGSPSFPNTEEASLSTSPDWQFVVEDEQLRSITNGIAELLPEDLNLSSSFPSTDMSPSTQSWEDLDIEL